MYNPATSRTPLTSPSVEMLTFPRSDRDAVAVLSFFTVSSPLAAHHRSGEILFAGLAGTEPIRSLFPYCWRHGGKFPTW